MRKEEHWLKSYWRPAMAWLYALICLFDFILFPLIGIFFIHPYVAWVSITLQSGGLVHMAFGAILGISAWTRGKEKLKEITNGEET